MSYDELQSREHGVCHRQASWIWCSSGYLWHASAHLLIHPPESQFCPISPSNVQNAPSVNGSSPPAQARFHLGLKYTPGFRGLGGEAFPCLLGTLRSHDGVASLEGNVPRYDLHVFPRHHFEIRPFPFPSLIWLPYWLSCIIVEIIATGHRGAFSRHSS